MAHYQPPKLKGRLFRTKDGNFGILLNKSVKIDGKVPLLWTDSDFKPLLNKNKQQQKLLVSPENLIAVGFQD